MPREKEGFRDNVERIKEAFPTKEMLSVSEVVQFTGLCNKTVRKMFSFQGGRNKYISVATLAREMC